MWKICNTVYEITKAYFEVCSCSRKAWLRQKWLDLWSRNSCWHLTLGVLRRRRKDKMCRKCHYCRVICLIEGLIISGLTSNLLLHYLLRPGWERAPQYTESVPEVPRWRDAPSTKRVADVFIRISLSWATTAWPKFLNENSISLSRATTASPKFLNENSTRFPLYFLILGILNL